MAGVHAVATEVDLTQARAGHAGETALTALEGLFAVRTGFLLIEDQGLPTNHLRKFRARASIALLHGIDVFVYVGGSFATVTAAVMVAAAANATTRALGFVDDVVDEIADVFADGLDDTESLFQHVPYQIGNGYPQILGHATNVLRQGFGDARVKHPLLAAPAMTTGAARPLRPSACGAIVVVGRSFVGHNVSQCNTM